MHRHCPTLRLLSAVGAVCALAGCGGYSHTVRLVDGEPIDARPISSAAYANYMLAAQLEASGNLEAALTTYREALSQDSDSVDIQTRIASLTCKLFPERATAAFEDALDADPDYEVLWREWALCELGRDKRNRALRMARRAVRHAPNSLDATLALAQVHEGRNEPESAIRQLVAYVTRFPHDRAAWRALYALARRQNDAAWVYTAGRASSGPLASHDDLAALGDDPATVVRRVLLGEGLERARHAAVEHGVTQLELGWIAIELTRPEDALQQAELVLGANPQRLEAAVLGLVASHYGGRDAPFREWLKRVPLGDPTELSPAAREALLEVLRERVGSDGATAFQEALQDLQRSEPLASERSP